MVLTLAALKSELLNDPQTYGYAAHIAAAEPELIADMLNKVRVGDDGELAISIRRSDVASQEILEAIAITDFPALPTNPNNAQLSTERRSLSYLEMLSNISQVRLLNDDGTDTPVIANLRDIFPVGSGTRTRLVALASRPGSRTEQLFGAGVTISTLDVVNALRA